MNKDELLFSKVGKYQDPPTILFRSIELKLLKERLGYLLGKDKSILDLGCGDGIAAAALFQRKVDYGLDNNVSALEQAEKRKVYKKIVCADARNIPLRSGSIDLVFSNCVIEHIKELDAILKEVSRILVPDGLFIFTAPGPCFRKYSVFSRCRLTKLAKIYGKLRDKKYEHYHTHSLKEWSSILEKFGFRVTDGYYYIDKEILEFWDLLIWVNRALPKWIYQPFVRKLIHGKFMEAKVADSTGAAVCVVAKKL